MKQYWKWVKEYAGALNGDGCTSTPDFFYRRCCDEHDLHYRVGCGIDGRTLTRAQADKKLFICMRKAGKTPIIGRLIIPALFWLAVRLFARKAWKGNW